MAAGADARSATPGDGAESLLVRELRASQARLELALSQISEGLVICDRGGALLWCNAAFERLIGRPRLLLLGASFPALVSALLPDEERLNIVALLKSCEGRSFSALASRDPLRVLEIECQSVPGDSSGSMVFGFRDVSDRVSLEELRLRSEEVLVRQLALAAEVKTCPVTGLPNRRGLLEAVNQALLRQRTQGGWVGLLFCDLNRFKEVNDTYGHDIGDQLLIELSRRMRQVLRPGDLLARLGGDEFVLLLDALEGPDEAVLVAQRLSDAVSMPWVPRRGGSEFEINPELSIGISVADRPLRSAEELLHDADLAMYEAKVEKQSPIVVFDESIKERLQRRIRIRTLLQRCLQRREIDILLQPVVSLCEGRSVGFEALLQPMEVDGLRVLPQDLISIAESSGLIVPLGQLLLEVSLQSVVGIDYSLYPHGLAINVSPLQLVSAGLARRILAEVSRHDFPPGWVCVEITETALIDNPERAREEISLLREGGCRVVLDDFGTGYSSLTWLAELPIDGLKIDRSFIAPMAADERRRKLVSGVLELARLLGLEVIAEGIETAELSDQLQAMDCGLGQGYYFSPPLRPERLLELPSLLPAAPPPLMR